MSYRLSPTKQRTLQAAMDRCIAGSRLVERAVRIQPTRERAASYVFCLRLVLEVAPARAKEMAQYILDHPEQFKESPNAPWVKIAQTKPLQATDEGDSTALDRALANAEQDPNSVLILFPPGLTRNAPAGKYDGLLAKYQDSLDPVVQFVVQRAWASGCAGRRKTLPRWNILTVPLP